MLKSLFIACCFFLSFANAATPHRVLIILNEGYRPEEYFEPRKLFEEAGYQVKVAAHYAGVVRPSRKHISEVPAVPADLTFDQVSVQN